MGAVSTRTRPVQMSWNLESRKDTISVFNGPPPSIHPYDDEDAEAEGVAAWLLERSDEGLLPHEIGIFVRSNAAVNSAELDYLVLDDGSESTTGKVSISTMHLAKGLEFRGVVVMAVDDEVVPLQERIETVGDDADLQEVYDTERHLLYVACTRARDQLLVTCVEPGSEFLEDMAGSVGSV